MKRKIGEIYNKPIVEGDKNLVTNNEIHKDELGSGSSRGGDIEYIDLKGKDAIKGMPYSILTSVSNVVCATIISNNATTIVHYPTEKILKQTSNVLAIHAVRVDWSAKASYVSADVKTAKETFLGYINEEKLAALPRLTEEEFYALN